ncbi:MAG: hypothetical protein ACI8P0_004596 [Planctomycetaceae bacterium]|jgi:hypothetical protein
MWILYGVKRDDRKLVATFGSEAQLRAYVQWAILKKNDDGTLKFEQKTPLTGCTAYDFQQASSDEEAVSADVAHNPSPAML